MNPPHPSDPTLLLNVQSVPTLAEILAAGVEVPAAVAVLIATDVAIGLLHIHQMAQSHGHVGTHTVVLTSAGQAMLSDPQGGTTPVGAKATVVPDATGWAQLVRELAALCADRRSMSSLLGAAQQAEEIGGSSGLAMALATVAATGQRLGGSGDRAPVTAYVRQALLLTAQAQSTNPSDHDSASTVKLAPSEWHPTLSRPVRDDQATARFHDGATRFDLRRADAQSKISQKPGDRAALNVRPSPPFSPAPETLSTAPARMARKGRSLSMLWLAVGILCGCIALVGIVSIL